MAEKKKAPISEPAVEEVKKELTTKEQLDVIGREIQGIEQSQQITMKIAEGKTIRILDVTQRDVPEGEEDPGPLSVNLSGDIVLSVLQPIITYAAKRKEMFLAKKEQLLNIYEKELNSK